MPLITPYQADFSSGELSPKLWGRIDLDQYYSGAASLLNFCVMPYGPITRRSGTEFIAEAKSTGKIRLVSFIYSIKQSVIIEFGDRYARFFYEGGQIYDGDDIYEIETPWTADMLDELRFAQSGDILYVVCSDVRPARLERHGWTDWRIAYPEFTRQPEEWTEGNWPRMVCFFDQRLILANTKSDPQKVWCSRVGNFHDFTTKTTITAGSTTDTEVMDTDAIIYTISSDDVNAIAWLLPLEILAIGTEGAEYKCAASTLNEALTPNNFRVVKQTTNGSAKIQAVSVGTGAMFIQRTSNRVRLYDFDYYTNQWNAINATVFADHIAAAGVKALAVQTSPDTYAWCLLGDGKLACFTYEKQQKINAWHRHAIAGGFCTSLAIIPGQNSDEVWLAVKRTIDGVEQQYIERLAPAFHSVYDEESNYTYLDCWLRYQGEPTNVIYGLDHLEGCTVRPLVDKWVHPDVVVQNGSITLQHAGSDILVGLPYLSRFVSLEIQSQDQLTVGAYRNMYRADVSIYRTLGLKSGMVDDTIADLDDYTPPLDEIYMGPTQKMNAAAKPQTGVKEIEIRADHVKGARLLLQTDYPLPATIRGVKYFMDIN